uniref:HEAT repeat containing 9 n=1 Tax=Nannospalax galili TaxID=1026970 RepID=A0A8C6QTP1_NANGA
VDCFDIVKSMFKYPWLEYQNRTKEFRKVMTPVLLPLSYYKMVKEEFPPNPEYWRIYPCRPNAIPFCRSKKQDLFLNWRILHDQRKERESHKIIQKKRNLPRYFKDSAQIPNLHVSLSELTLKSKVETRSLGPTRDPLKWQRLKELTTSLKSPREDEQHYAAYALGQLGINDESVVDTLWQVVSLRASWSCLNKHVIQALIKQLTGQNECKRMETLTGLRVALNSWAAVPKSKVIGRRAIIGAKKVKVIISLEAALCLGFLRPCSNTVQEFLLQSLYQGPMTQRMKALRMLVKIMHIHSATVTKPILDQLCSSDDRFEATQMLKTIGLEEIQAQGLEELTFDLLKKKMHNEPFLTMRQAMAGTAEKLKMKPLMMDLMEAQLMSPNASDRQEAVISLGALGIRNPQVFHLLENQSVKKSPVYVVWASIHPWIQNKLKNKVFFVYDIPKKTVKAKPRRFQKEPDDLEDLHIRDFRLAKLSPLFIAKAGNKVGQKKELPAFSFYFSKPQKQKPQATGPWQPKVREQLRNLVKSQNRFVSSA